jgi:hypothetical protein
MTDVPVLSEHVGTGTEWYRKHSGLVPPSVQQLRQREAPVDGSKSVCHVARSWMDVGSFHTFSGEVYDFCSVSPEYFELLSYSRL